MRAPGQFLIFLAGVVALALASGCAHVGAGSHAGEKYVVNTQRTLFYKYGPAQSTGPDAALYRGQRLTMLSYQFGYSHIGTEDGQSGYVSTDDLAPAPPEPPVSPNADLLKKARARRRERAPTGEEQGRVPLPDLPLNKLPPNAPGFRY